ncbi:exported protein (hyp1) [Plasmodium gaboni]|uniref:Exported protein (Hyp1) n=1 Tax=Plasmodium gaboni TaxID=647221 RepID=A0A151LX42_9APIC|nr:exported protein (hyp1) [Plasmodium gaboni]KYO03765.1 exported protein (hyp1) [Plasmodium gaboni]
MKNIKRELFLFFVVLFFLYIICGCIYEKLYECQYNKIYNNPHESEKYRQFNKIRLLSENKNILEFNKEKISLHDYINNDNYNTLDAIDYNFYNDKEEQCNDTTCVDKKNYNRTNNNEEECSKNFYQYLKYMEQNVNVNTNNINTELQIISNDHNKQNYNYDNNSDNNNNNSDNNNNNNSEYGETNYFLERNNKLIDSQQNEMNNIFQETINKTLTYDMSTENSHTNNNSIHYETQNGNREYMNLSNNNLTYIISPYDILPYNDQNNLSQYETLDSNHCNDLNIYNPYYQPIDLPYYEPVSYAHDRSNNYSHHSNHNYSHHSNHNYSHHSNHNYSHHSNHNYPHHSNHNHNHSHHNHPHHNHSHHNHSHHNHSHHNHHRYGPGGDPYHRHDHIMDRSYYNNNLQNDNDDMMLTYNQMNDNKSLYDEQNFELELKKIIKKNHLQNGNITDSCDTRVSDYNKKLVEYNKKLNEYNEKLNEYTRRLNEYNKKHNENKQSRQNNNENTLSQDIVLYGADFQNAFRYRQNTRSYYSNIHSNREEDLDRVIDFTNNNNASEDEYTFGNEQEIYHQHSKRLEKKLFDYQNGTNPLINFLERHF